MSGIVIVILIYHRHKPTEHTVYRLIHTMITPSFSGFIKTALQR
jgi:hypothetical protein